MPELALTRAHRRPLTTPPPGGRRGRGRGRRRAGARGDELVVALVTQHAASVLALTRRVSLCDADADDAYQRLVNGFGTQVQSAQQIAANQQALTAQIDNAHEQLAGVNTDEETISLMTAQRGYEAAARVLSTMDSILDTLIHHTGLVG